MPSRSSRRGASAVRVFESNSGKAAISSHATTPDCTMKKGSRVEEDMIVGSSQQRLSRPTARRTHLYVEVGTEIPLDMSQGMLPDRNRRAVATGELVHAALYVSGLIPQSFGS